MKKVAIKSVLIIALMLMVIVVSGQPAPGDTGLNGGEGSAPVGGGASIGGGLLIMLSMALGYLGRRIYEMRKSILE